MNKVISVTEKRRLSEFAHALVTRARSQPQSETSSELPPLTFTSGVSTMDSLLLHLTEIAVGTPIAERPPHRSVLAEFPHTAPTLGV